MTDNYNQQVKSHTDNLQKRTESFLDILLLIPPAILSLIYFAFRPVYHALLSIATLPIKIVSSLLKFAETQLQKLSSYLKNTKLNLLIYPLGLLQLCLGLFLFTPIFWLNNTLSYLKDKLQLPVVNSYDGSIDHLISKCEKVFDINNRRPTNQKVLIDTVLNKNMGLNKIISYPFELIQYVLEHLFKFLDMSIYTVITSTFTTIICVASLLITSPLLLISSKAHENTYIILATTIIYPYQRLANLLFGTDHQVRDPSSIEQRQLSLAEIIIDDIKNLAVRLFDFALCLIVSPFILVYELIYNLINFVQAKPDTSDNTLHPMGHHYGLWNAGNQPTSSDGVLPGNGSLNRLSSEEDDVDFDFSESREYNFKKDL